MYLSSVVRPFEWKPWTGAGALAVRLAIQLCRQHARPTGAEPTPQAFHELRERVAAAVSVTASNVA